MTWEWAKTAKPRAGRDRDFYFDAGPGHESGLALRVTSAGGRTWVYRYRLPGSDVKRVLMLGECREGRGGMSLSEARAAAAEQRKIRRQGDDPHQKREAVRQAETEARAERELVEQRQQRETLAAAAAAYIQTIGPKWSKRTREERERMLAAYIGPAPIETPGASRRGKRKTPTVRLTTTLRPVAELKRYELRDDLARIGGVMANRVMEFLRAASRWAVAEDRLPFDLLSNMQPVSEEAPRARVLTDAEVARLWSATELLRPASRVFFRLLLLCGTRRGETAAATWDQFDLEAGVWTIPAANRKGRERKRRDLALPLPSLAVEMLKALPQKKGERLFPESYSQRQSRPLAALRRKIAGLDESVKGKRTRKTKDQREAERWTPHDLRRTLATRVRELGVRLDVVSRLLGHTTEAGNGVAAATVRYDRSELWPERVAAMTAWDAEVRRILKAPDAPGKVLAWRA
jgi:integrase